MPAYPFNPSTFTWNAPHPHPSGTFRPTGRLERYGDESWMRTHNPRGWKSARTVVGRLFVGFSVGEVPTYTLDNLIPIVERVRTAQTGNPSASFVAQRGIYQSRKTRQVVNEDGAQIFIINTDGVDDDVFADQMVELAETIAREFQQEEVIVEIQVNGISQYSMGIEP